MLPHFGWRPVFFLGVLPALFTFWIRRRVEESALWRAEAASLRLLFQGPLARRTLSATSMNAATLFA